MVALVSGINSGTAAPESGMMEELYREAEGWGCARREKFPGTGLAGEGERERGGAGSGVRKGLKAGDTLSQCVRLGRLLRQGGLEPGCEGLPAPRDGGAEVSDHMTASPCPAGWDRFHGFQREPLGPLLPALHQPHGHQRVPVGHLGCGADHPGL